MQGLWTLLSVSNQGYVGFASIFFHFGDTGLGGLTLTVCFIVLKGVSMALFYLWEDSTARRRYGQLLGFFLLQRNQLKRVEKKYYFASCLLLDFRAS